MEAEYEEALEYSVVELVAEKVVWGVVVGVAEGMQELSNWFHLLSCLQSISFHLRDLSWKSNQGEELVQLLLVVSSHVALDSGDVVVDVELVVVVVLVVGRVPMENSS